MGRARCSFGGCSQRVAGVVYGFWIPSRLSDLDSPLRNWRACRMRHTPVVGCSVVAGLPQEMEVLNSIRKQKCSAAFIERACRSVLELLEERRLWSATTIQTLPFALDFSSD